MVSCYDSIIVTFLYNCWRSGEVGCRVWGSGEVGKWGSGEIELKPQNPNPQHLKPKTCLLSPDSENTDS
nr:MULTISPECIES: hypothetical protein [unclassified Microcystis]